MPRPPPTTSCHSPARATPLGLPQLAPLPSAWQGGEEKWDRASEETRGGPWVFGHGSGSLLAAGASVVARSPSETPMGAPLPREPSDGWRRPRSPGSCDQSAIATQMTAAAAPLPCPQAAAGPLSASGVSGPPVAASARPDAGQEGFFRLRRIRVQNLFEDGTLGLLLHGTSIVGFCTPLAETLGWAVGDQIVEVNGHRVAMFDDFLDRFLEAKDGGFPIDFSVLRREPIGGLPNGGLLGTEPVLPNTEIADVESTLTSFLDDSDLGDIADQLHRKFGSLPDHRAVDLSPTLSGIPPDEMDPNLHRCDSITENPYIQALRKRRHELMKTSEGWEHHDETGPSRLATQRSDALATLLANGPKHQEHEECGALVGTIDVTVADCGDSDGRGPGLVMPRGLSGLPSWSLPFSCGSAQCGPKEAHAFELQPTPRADLESVDVDPKQFGTPAASQRGRRPAASGDPSPSIGRHPSSHLLEMAAHR